MPSLGLAACLCTARRAIPTSFQQPDRWILVDKGSASGKEISQRGVTWSQTLKAQSSRRPANLPATLTWRLTARLKRMPEKFKRLSARLKRLSGHRRINIKLGDGRGQEIMTQSMFEQTGEQIADTAHKASRAASAVADALEDGVGAARRAAKQGCYAAAELVDDTKRRVQRHPIETVVATFAVGIAAGTAISWMMRRRQLCCKADAREKVQSSCPSSQNVS